MTLDCLPEGVSVFLQFTDKRGATESLRTHNVSGRVLDSIPIEGQSQLVLQLSPEATHLIVCRIQKKGNTTPLVRCHEISGEYLLNLRIRQESDQMLVDHHQSTFRIVELDGDRLHIYEVGVLGRAGKLFLAAEVGFDVACFQKNGRVLVPELSYWETLCDFLNENCAPQVRKLPEFPESFFARPVDVSDLEASQARVTGFRLFHGLGNALLSDGREVRFHWSKGRRLKDNPVQAVSKGQIITFDKTLPGKNGTLELDGWSAV